MSVAAPQALRVEVDDAGRRLELDLAGGRLRVTGAGLALEGTELGLLQTAPRWSSVTGIVRDTATGEVLGVVLIVDEVGSAVTLHVDGRPTLAWRLASRHG